MATKTKVIVLAAGKGERMRSEIPKCMHEILGKSIINYVLDVIKEAGLKDVLIVTGYKEELVRERLDRNEYQFVTQKEQKGTGHALMSCKEALKGFKGNLLVLTGDAPLISADTVKRLARAIEVFDSDAILVTAAMDDPTGYGRIVRDNKGRIRKIQEEVDTSSKEKVIQEVNSGFYGFRAPEIFELLSKVKSNNEKGEYYITTIIDLLTSKGKKVDSLRLQDPRESYGVNTRHDLVICSNVIRWRILESHMENGVTVVDPSTTFIEQNVEIGQDTVINPYTVIRYNVRLGRGCKIGPFAHLRPGTTLEDYCEIGNFVEVKNSKIGRKSRAKHLSYLGDALLGQNVNIGAGTITANYDQGKKNKTVIEDGGSTGCNTVLIAPVKMGKNSKTGAGTIVPKNKNIPDNDVVVGVPAKSIKMRVARSQK